MTYNERFIYVAAICFDEQNYFVETLKRDNFDLDDAFAILLDPVNRQSNGYGFGVNVLGAQTEILVEVNGLDNSWDNKWFSKTQQYEDRWTVEMAIPFKTLRFKSSKQDSNFYEPIYIYFMYCVVMIQLSIK